MKKSIRDFLRFPNRRPARTAVLPATIIANSSHSTVNCSVCTKEKAFVLLYNGKNRPEKDSNYLKHLNYWNT